VLLAVVGIEAGDLRPPEDEGRDRTIARRVEREKAFGGNRGSTGLRS
jgi:hypothetical protein